MYSNSQQTKQEKKTQQVKSKNFSTQGTKLNPTYVEDMILSVKIFHQICLLNFTRDIQLKMFYVFDYRHHHFLNSLNN